MEESAQWQTLKFTIQSRGQYLLETSLWSDCTFLLGSKPRQQKIKCHKMLLAMASPVFGAMFFGGLAEKDHPIPILDVQPEAFKALLKYIYTDSINLQSFDQASELCYVANKYMLPHLEEECTKFIQKNILPCNVGQAFQFAKLFQKPKLVEECLKIICLQTEEVLREPSFQEVELATLIMVLEQDKLKVPSELHLFNAMHRWGIQECNRKGLQVDYSSLRSVLGTAVHRIRFLTLRAEEFANGPAHSSLLTPEESYKIFMNILSGSKVQVALPDGFTNSKVPRNHPVYMRYTLSDKLSASKVPQKHPAHIGYGQRNTDMCYYE